MRDFEILKRQTGTWNAITVWTGHYPGFQESVREGIRYRSLGFAGGYLVSRLSFILAANFRILFDGAEAIGYSLSAYAPLLLGLLRPRRFYMVAHHYVGAGSQEKYSLLGSVAWLSEWLLFKFGRTMVVSNAKVAERARTMNPNMRVLQSQNGFDAALLKVEAREANPAFLLFLGRFDIYMKGLDRLVAAYGRIRPDLRDKVRLVMAGAASPKALAAVRKLVKDEFLDRIELVPNVPEPQKRELLSSCLFYCSPSRFEGWGIAALEANAAGKPVVVTRADGFLDSIKEGYSGLMVPLEDEQALIDGMEKLIEDSELRHRMGMQAREWASRFTWDRIAQREAEWLSNSLKSLQFDK